MRLKTRIFALGSLLLTTSLQARLLNTDELSKINNPLLHGLTVEKLEVADDSFRIRSMEINLTDNTFYQIPVSVRLSVDVSEEIVRAKVEAATHIPPIIFYFMDIKGIVNGVLSAFEESKKNFIANYRSKLLLSVDSFEDVEIQMQLSAINPERLLIRMISSELQSKFNSENQAFATTLDFKVDASTKNSAINSLIDILSECFEKTLEGEFNVSEYELKLTSVFLQLFFTLGLEFSGV